MTSYDNHHDYQTNNDLEYAPERNNNKNLTLEYGKTIKLLRNGDEFYSGQKFVINSRKYRYFDVFLDDLSNTLNARFGAVRNIHTPLHGHKIKSLDQIEDGKTYVASGVGKFKKLNYLEIAEGRKPIPHRLPALNRRPFLSNDTQTKPLFEKTTNVFIFVYRNGDVLTPPVKVLLYKHTLASFESVLNEITYKVQLQNGAVLRLYTLDGTPVTDAQQLNSGTSYVATNKERFKRCEYFSPEDFGISPRLVRKSDLNTLSNPVTVEMRQRKMWLPVNSQPSSQSVPGSTASMSGKTTYSGKPYTGWHPSREESSTKPNNKLRNPPFVKPINVDNDESGLYKARNNKNQDIKEIPDNDDIYVDIPVEKKRAKEIESEEIINRQNERPPKNEINKNPEFQKYRPESQEQNLNTNSKKTQSPTKTDDDKRSKVDKFEKEKDRTETVSSPQYSQRNMNGNQSKISQNETLNDNYRDDNNETVQTDRESNKKQDTNSNNNNNTASKRYENRYNKELNDNEAASIIQASFRGYKTRKANESDKTKVNNQSDSDLKNFNLHNPTYAEHGSNLFKWYIHNSEPTVCAFIDMLN